MKRKKNVTPKPTESFDMFRSTLTGAAACLILATVLFPGESLTRYGNGLLPTILWFVLAAFCAAGMFFAGSPDYRSENNNETKNRLLTPQRIIDIFVLFFFSWTTLSFLYLLPEGYSTPRYMLNSYFAWMSFAAMWYVFRCLVFDSTTTRTFLALLICVAFAQAACGFYQRIFEMPQMVREYELDKEFFLQQNGITPGSPEQELFENRIKNTQPLGTYSLTNTLAGVLAPMLVLVFGVTIFNLRDGKTKEDFPDIYFGRSVCGGVIAAVLAVCLLLTQSRSGCIAAFFGMLCVLAAIFFSGRFSRKNIVTALVPVSVLCGVIISIGWVFGGWNTDMVTAGAKKSLGYRLEYWVSSWGMIRDYPLIGCGPGNFQHVYPRYKLPYASEEIADPHNFLVEIASNFGLPAMVFFVVVLCGVLLYGMSFPSKNNETENNAAVTNPKVSVLVGAFSGFVVLYFVSLPAEVPLAMERLAVLFFAFFVSFILTIPLFVRGADTPKAVLNMAIVTLFINLLAAGGIAYPNVAVTFWLLAGIIVSENASEKLSQKIRSKNKIRPLFCGCVFVALLFSCYRFSYAPSIAAMLARHDANSAANLPEFAKHCEKVVQADELSFENYRQLFFAQLELYKATGREEDLRNAIASQERTVKLAPFSGNVRKDIADALMNAYDRTKKRAILSLALERYTEAVVLYPNHAKTHAPLAVALWKSGKKNEAISAAKSAIQLDDITPHTDQKLAAPLRRQIEQIIETENQH